MVIRVGQMAPDFSLETQLGRRVRLSEYRYKCNVVLAFFPLAWTPI
jgi:peroxiredoxin